MAKKKIFLSDIHMGIDAQWTWLSAEEAKECAKFLNVISEDSTIGDVLLVGDIMDDNVCPIDQKPATFEEIFQDHVNSDLVAALKKIDQNSSIKLHYVKGNHDVAMDEASVKKFLPNVDYCEKKYEVKNLIAIHGNAYQMWCAPDERADNKFNPLPLGYFISRMWATMEKREKIKTKTPIASIIKNVVNENKLDPTKKSFLGINVPKVVIEFVTSKTGLSLDDVILMNTPYQDAKIGDLIENYRVLEKIWEKKYGLTRFIDYAIAYDNFVGDMCLEKDKRIIIWGHTHDKILRQPYPARKSAYIYANCGNWCDQSKRVPNFIETEIEPKNSIHFVRLKKWNINKQKIELVNEMSIKE